MLPSSARILASVVALGSVVLSGCTSPPDEAPVPPRQCPYTDHDLGRFAAFEQLLGTTLDCALIFSDVTPTWQEWEHPWFLRGESVDDRHDWAGWAAADPTRRLVVTQSLIPTDVPDDWRLRGANGEYEQHARAFAEALVEAGLGDSIIRLGHEPNGTWYEHSVGESPEERADWKRFWARTVTAMRSVEDAAFEFDLSVNAGHRPIPLAEYYPGDDVVDIVGVDQYDSYTGPTDGMTPEERWIVVRDQPGGLSTIARFAAEHGKPLALPETGLVAADRHGAGDDPAYVRGLREFMATHDVRYIGYFDKNVKGTLRLSEVPASLEEWKALVTTPGRPAPAALPGRPEPQTWTWARRRGTPGPRRDPRGG